ncbi:MAG: preprotein translocase subunit YajC [Nitrosomonas sp.]|jgi:preprotein translocase subunit YajC|nr:preprotein translocase subunit YajC [Nitrosomonas sp.]
MLISEAFAQTAGSGQAEAGWANLILLVGIFVIFWLLLIRPQAKRAKDHKKMVENLQRGDEVITGGGIIGLILNVSESYVVVEISPGVEILAIKSSVQTLLPKGTMKSIEPSKGGKQPRKAAAKGNGNAPAQDDKSAADKETVAADESEGSGNAETSKADEKN